jgi:ABC-type spermidine/putrescine transport system permease subunit I
VALLATGLAVYAALLAYPLGHAIDQSFRLFVPGRVGAAGDATLTLKNYAELLDSAYIRYFFDTFRIGLLASIASLVFAFPIALYIARHRSPVIRKTGLALLIGTLFVSVLVRVYALELTFGSAGFLAPVFRQLGVRQNSRTFIEILVILGLLHYTVPMSSLILIGTLQNVNPRLAEAAQALGASKWRSHLLITIPLSARGLLSAFLISSTLSISAFVIPMVLGKGRVAFVSNLIYNRFSEVANFPSGAAIAVVMLIISLSMVWAVSALISRRWDR